MLGKMSPKVRVAFVSVLAAVLLVSTKLIVGLSTNSLGVLSEALHSGIDLIAAAMTLVAVRMADRPPDRDHQYGHEKIESLSSLAETALLFITCAWIVYEAVQRLFFHDAVVDITYVAILVMLMSIVVDYTRSRALMKAAKKYRSQALEADAIHFSTDLLSSIVVLGGIIATLMGFKSFDAIAALGVAAITAVIGYRIWKRSMHTLLDGAPSDIDGVVVQKAMIVQGVRKVDRVRVRESGPRVFIDAQVSIDKTLPLEQAHRVTEDVTRSIEQAVPYADVMIHAEPCSTDTGEIIELIRAEAVNFPEIRTVHNILVSEVDGLVHVDFHVEVDPGLSLDEAHMIATRLEDRIKQMDGCIYSISSHLEPLNNHHLKGQAVGGEYEEMKRSMGAMVISHPKVVSVGQVDLWYLEGKLKAGITCKMQKGMNVQEGHEVSTDLENRIRSRYPDLSHVLIHIEPQF